jgi:hypothetical protein
MHSAEPDLSEWQHRCRLDTTRGMADHMDDPRMQEAMGRLGVNLEPALAKADDFLAPANAPV